jgi:hypothetical protein
MTKGNAKNDECNARNLHHRREAEVRFRRGRSNFVIVYVHRAGKRWRHL